MEQYTSISRSSNQSYNEKKPEENMVNSEPHARNDQSEVINKKKYDNLQEQINNLERQLKSSEDDLKKERSLRLKQVS